MRISDWSSDVCPSDLSVARTCDVPAADLRQFYELFVANSRTVTLFSQGINQATAGTDQVNAITNLHLATARIGKPGAAPFSITGQPNAMGRSEEHTSELQSLMRNSYAVFCLKKKNTNK